MMNVHVLIKFEVTICAKLNQMNLKDKIFPVQIPYATQKSHSI